MKSSFRTFGTLALAAAALSAGCSGPNEGELMTSARTYLAKGDAKAAVIQLKAALQANPSSGEARYLLGKALLEAGDATSASVELSKAMELKRPPSEVLPVLAKALVRSGQFKTLTDNYGTVDLPEAAAAASLKTSVATAHAAQRNYDKADAAVSQALRAVPDYAPALVAEAQTKGRKQQFDDALGLLDKATSGNPSEADAWQVKGDIFLFGKGDAPRAMEAYQKALSVEPENIAARSSAISLALAQHDFERARAQLEELRKRQPKHPQITYFDAQLALISGDRAKARELVQQLLKVAPDNSRVLELAGAAEFANGSLVQADAFLGKAVQQSPSLVAARQLLVKTYLRTGQTGKALATLKPLLDGAAPPAEAYSLAGAAFLQAGDVAQAEAQFAKAAKLDPKDVKSRTALAMTRLQTRNVDTALDELRAIALSDTGTYADMALMSTYLRARDYDNALKVASAIESKQPGKPFAAQLKGQIFSLRKDVVQARRSYEQALAIDSAFVPAVVGLATLDLKENKIDVAQKRFESVLSVNPKNMDALLALAGLRERAGGTKDEVVEILARAVDFNPTEAAPRLALASRHFADKQYEKALVAAQAGVTALPDNPSLLDTLGRAQLAVGETNQAINTFNKLALLQPQSAAAQMRIAGAHLVLKDSAAAAQDIRKALAISPNLLAAQQSLVDLELAAKRPREALQIARTVQKQRPNEAAGFMLEGKAELAQKNVDAGVATYRIALQKEPSAALAAKLYSVLVEVGRPTEAEQFAAAWNAGHPKDVDFQRYIGELALSVGNFAVAESQFRNVLKVQSDNAVALNNLAWILVQTNRPGASATAQRAVDLAPSNASFVDTLAFALAAENQLDRAVELQKRAVALAPDASKLRLNLARMLLKVGDKAAARTELEALTKLGDKFENQPEVRQMSKSL